jgi:prevent-host-death family protein
MATNPSDIVTIREVHRETRKVLDRVERGERVIVTRNREEVAEIVPIDPARRLLARWEKEGIAPPAPEGGWATTGSIRRDAAGLPAGTSGRTLGELLAEMREEERWC